MREFSIESDLKRVLKRIAKRDRVTHNAIMNKIEEVLICKDISHYKNLRSPLQEFKRVHINGPFVLIFKYYSNADKVEFYELDHHDNIYN